MAILKVELVSVTRRDMHLLWISIPLFGQYDRYTQVHVGPIDVAPGGSDGYKL